MAATLTINIILDAVMRSSDVDYNGDTIRSRITTYSRIHHQELRNYLPELVAQGLIIQEKILTQDNPRHASRMSDKNRANATRTIYRVTPKGHQWLREQEQHYPNHVVSEHR
jgi:predicted transcriptional regulator